MTLENSKIKKTVSLLAVLCGTLFCFYYIGTAADNVAYSDYIRLINSYLPDVENPSKFFVPDILTRVPITYAARLFNVKVLGFNTMFDMGLGVLSFGLGAAALAGYAVRQKKISVLWFLSVLLVYFGLNKWEMLTNGTGWVCFLSISGFYWHFALLDRVVYEKAQAENEKKKTREQKILLVLPSVLTLLTAGPYCGGYSAVLLLVYSVLLFAKYRKKQKIDTYYAACLISVLIPLFLYLWSNSQAVYVHRGATDQGMIEVFLADPLFFVRFLLKAFASAVLGVGQIEAFAQKGSLLGRDAFVYALGIFAAVLYLAALFLNWKEKIYEETLFPLLLILSGGVNHLLILSARWIFLKDSYGMSSRYEIQYQMGLIGIFLTFAWVWKLKKETEKTENEQEEPPKQKDRTRDAAYGKRKNDWIFRICAAAGTSIVLAGSLYTTKEEWKTAPYRKIYLETSREIALNYKTASDEELNEYLHHDPEEIRKAMKILEENHLNIFRKR